MDQISGSSVTSGNPDTCISIKCEFNKGGKSDSQSHIVIAIFITQVAHFPARPGVNWP